jgi:hypothetical protein
VKFKQNIYQIGECVHLFDPTGTVPYVVRIHSIIRTADAETPAMLVVEWLLRRSDLPPKF